MKKAIIALVVGISLVSGAVIESSTSMVFADCGDIETSIIDCPSAGGGTPRYLAMDIVNILSVGIGIVGVIGIMIFGTRMLTSRDDPKRVAESRKRFFQIVIGLVVYLLMWTGVNWLLPGGVIGGRIATESIMISPSTAEIVLGETSKLNVAIFPLDADDQTVKWESSDPSVAEVDKSGNVTAKAIGDATITATAVNGSSFQSTVHVIASYDPSVDDDEDEDEDDGGDDGAKIIATSINDATFAGPYNNYCSTKTIFPGKKYNLSRTQILKIASRVIHEDSAGIGASRLMASQIINLYEYRKKYNNKEARGKSFWEWFKSTGWYATEYYGLTTKISKKKEYVITAVIDVIVNGNRYLPPQVAGFDTLELNYPGHKYNITHYYNKDKKRHRLTKSTVKNLVPKVSRVIRREASSKKFWCITKRKNKKHPYGTAYTFGD